MRKPLQQFKPWLEIRPNLSYSTTIAQFKLMFKFYLVSKIQTKTQYQEELHACSSTSQALEAHMKLLSSPPNPPHFNSNSCSNWNWCQKFKHRPNIKERFMHATPHSKHLRHMWILYHHLSEPPSHRLQVWAHTSSDPPYQWWDVNPTCGQLAMELPWRCACYQCMPARHPPTT